VVSEKPFRRTPADGDEVLALAERNEVRIAVAHQMRLAAGVVHLKKREDDGLIGGRRRRVRPRPSDGLTVRRISAYSPPVLARE
jgi:predicted dehydrogenase